MILLGNNNNKVGNLLVNPIFITVFIASILCLVTINRPLTPDEGLWSYIGRLWVENNIPPYIGAVENKTPGIFILNAISYYLFGVNVFFTRIVAIIAILCTMHILNSIAKITFNSTSGILAMYIYGLLMSWHTLYGEIPAQTETFICFFTSLSFLMVVLYSKVNNNLVYLFLAGVFLGCSISFKQIAVLSTLAFFLFALINSKKGSLLLYSKIILCISLGLLLASFLFIIPLLMSGIGLFDFIQGAWGILLNPGSGNLWIERFYNLFRIWLNTRISTFLVLLILLLYNHKLLKNKIFLGLLIWLFFDFIGVNSSGNLFGHQIRQISPSLSLISGVLLSLTLIKFSKKVSEFKRNLTTIIIGIILIFLPYKNIFINGYFSGFPTIEKDLGLWLKDNSDKDDYIYAFTRANSGIIMTYSERVSSSRFFMITFITREKEKRIFKEEFVRNQPKYLVIHYQLPNKFNKMLPDQLDNYKKKFRTGKYCVFELI